jgi:alpha-1,2-mannosyltransferase
MDFSHYYVSALMMRQGIDPYTTNMKPLAESLGLGGLDFSNATYTPTFLLLFEPLTLLIPLAAYWVWIAITMAFLAMSLYLLLDGLPRDYRLRLSLVGLVILYPPITDNFFYAQSQIMLLFLFTLFMRGLGSGRHAFAGAIVGLAGLLRVFPLVLVGYLVVRRRWKATFYAGLVLVGGGLLTLALVGVGRSLNFVTVVPFLTSQHWLGRATNISLRSMISRIFWYSVSIRMEPRAAVVAYLRPGLELVFSN